MKIKNANHCISEVLYRLNIGVPVDLKLLEKAFNLIFTDQFLKARDTQLGALLSSIMVKGPTVDEVVTLIKTALSVDDIAQKKIILPKDEILVGVAGSGKKGVKTINISTPACIVAASGGAYVAKPGSSSTSSVNGSSDFMNIIGLKIGDCDAMIEVLLQTGFGFFVIENTIPKFDRVYGQKFFGPNPLSFAFPALLCPVKFDTLLYGLSHPNIQLSIEVFSKFGIKNLLVVCSTDDDIHFIDELGLFGHNYIAGIKDGIPGEVKNFNPLQELGLPHYKTDDIVAASSMLENVKYAVDVLQGKAKGAREDVVAINAAAILYLAKKVQNHKEGYKYAKELIQSGAAFEKLKQIIQVSGGDIIPLNILIGDK